MLKSIFLIPLLAVSTLSLADTISCGGKFVSVSDAPSANEPFFSVVIEGDSTSAPYQFEIQKDYLRLRCEVTSTGKHVILINNICGGSGCVEFGNFGIIDIGSGKVLLEPNQPFKGNRDQAEEIIGTELKPFTCEFNSIEVCMHSKIELG
ncbi:MAG TPA: hypothetical protein VF433_11160 [Cellvibrio sp.]